MNYITIVIDVIVFNMHFPLGFLLWFRLRMSPKLSCSQRWDFEGDWILGVTGVNVAEEARPGWKRRMSGA